MIFFALYASYANFKKKRRASLAVQLDKDTAETYQKERKDDTAYENPLCNVELDFHCTVVAALGVNLIRPPVG
jgi:hypothetical protein